MRIFIILALLLTTIISTAQESRFSISPYCNSNEVQEFERMEAMSSDYWMAKDMALSPDNRFIAIANLGYGRVQIVDAQTLSLVNVLPENPIVYPRNVSLAWSPDSRFLAVGTLIQTGNEQTSVEEIEIWDIDAYEMVLEIPNVEVKQIIWTANGDKLAVLEAYGDLSIWNPENGGLLNEQHLYSEYNLLPQIITLVFNDSLLVAWDGSWGKIVVWDFESNEMDIVDGFNNGTDIDTTWNQAQEILAAYSFGNGLIWLEDFPSNQPSTFTLLNISGLSGAIFDIVWSPDNTRLGAGTGYGLLLIDAETQVVTSYIGDSYPEFAKIAWFSDNNTLAALNRSGVLFTWDIANECVLAVSDYQASTTPTPSPSLIPSPTPIPAYHPQLLPVFEELLSENRGCDLPCFWGFNLGATTEEEWLSFFYENKLDEAWVELYLDESFSRRGGGGTYSLVTPYNNVSLGFALHNDRLSAIDLTIYAPNEWVFLDSNKFSFSGLLQQLGSNIEIYYVRGLSLADFNIVIMSDELGLFARYIFNLTTENENFQNLQLCLDIAHTNQINLKLQDNSAYDTSLSDSLRPLINYDDDRMSYRSLTELGINEENFIQFMIEHPDECFLTSEHQD